MFTVFVLKQNPRAIFVTTPDKFSRCLVLLKVMQDDVYWKNVSLESLMLLKDNQKDYIVLK